MSGGKIRNMEEFAAKSGVSRPTVSKYFNDPDSVRKSTRLRIEQALEKYDFRPNLYAVNQNRRMTKTIGIVVPYLADPFFAEIARRIETLVIEGGFRPILLSSHGDPALEAANLESLRAIKPAGVLLAPLGRTSDRSAIKTFCADVPTVNFDANIADAGRAFIGHDNTQATEVMIEYLVRSGSPPVFFEMRAPPNPNANKRRLAFISTMERLGHEPHIVQADGIGWELEEIGHRAGKQALSEGRFATDTIFCSNDRLAIGLLAAAYELGLTVGRKEDAALRIAGHDDHPFARFTCPTLTTISHNYSEISIQSVATLMAIINSDAMPDSRSETLFDGTLVMRDSA